MSDEELRRARDLEVGRWLRYAREGLALAAGISDGTRGVYRHACFLAQQAAEKAIKAAIILLHGSAQRWHDLESLRATLPDDWALRRQSWQLEELTDWAVAARYPGHMPEPTRADALQLVGLARDVVEAAERDLAEHGWKL